MIRRIRLRSRSALRLQSVTYSFVVAAIPTFVGLFLAGPPGALAGALAGAVVSSFIRSPAERAADRRVAEVEARLDRPESSAEQQRRVRQDVSTLAKMRRYGKISADE